MNKLSFDGKGINNKSKAYAPRVATFTGQSEAKEFGRLFESAPDLLTALTNMVKIFNQAKDKIEAIQAFVAIEQARHVIKKIKGEMI